MSRAIDWWRRNDRASRVADTLVEQEPEAAQAIPDTGHTEYTEYTDVEFRRLYPTSGYHAATRIYDSGLQSGYPESGTIYTPSD